MKEIWKDVPGYEGRYQASTFGRIRSLDRIEKRNRTRFGIDHGDHWFRAGRILAVSECPKGYHYVTSAQLPYRGKVSRLVALTFVPNPEDKPEVNHKDGIKANNRPENLEWVTHSENIQHAYDNGLITHVKGSMHPLSKLTEKDIPEIRRRLRKGESTYKIAEDYGVAQGTIFFVKSGKNWSHVK